MPRPARKSSRRLRSLVELVVLLLVTASVIVGFSAARAHAGTVADYPEFPYPATSYNEPYRGQFHFSPRSGWMNDVNGPVYYRGVYHLFFQHNPHGLAWDTMHWGHATSTDLVHWTQKPIALEPGVQNGDLWSGSAWVDTNNVTGLKTGSDDPILLFYNTGGVSIAYSVDGAKTFQMYNNGNKVITTAYESRDPKVTWDPVGNRWILVLYANDGSNGANFYTSTNLLSWTYRGQYKADWFAECPDLYRLPVDGNTANQKWVLQSASGEYVVGSLDSNGVFVSDTGTTGRKMDQGGTYAGGSFYASQTFNQLPGNRIVQMAWQGGNQGSTWTGNASFPAQLALKTIAGSPQITRNPVSEIAGIRSSTQTWGARTLTGPATDPFAGITADTYEIQAQFDLTGATATEFGFKLHSRSDGSSDSTVAYNVGAHSLYGQPLAPVNNLVTVRLLVDRGQLEIFGNDGSLSISNNINFNSAADSQGLSLYADGGSVKLNSLSFSRIGSTWGTGESTLQSNAAGPWRAVGGTWTDVTGGKQGSATGDAFYLSNQTGADFSYEGDVSLGTAAAAALTFRASANAGGHYTANIDKGGLVKLWRPGADLGTYNTPIVSGRSYHLKVVAAGTLIQVYLDHGTTPVISVNDGTYASGYFGANVFAGTGTVQNLSVNGPGFVTNLGGAWKPVNGTWTTTLSGAAGNAPADTFLLSGQSGTNFSYDGDLNIVNGAAAGLTFRADASGNGYTANVDSSGLVKLWRPGHDVATAQTAIRQNKIYHLHVVTNGSRIQVFLDGGASPIIDATDSTYASGFFGVNVYNGTGVVQNVRVT
jgi:fructan beta-fructosidase